MSRRISEAETFNERRLTFILGGIPYYRYQEVIGQARFISIRNFETLMVKQDELGNYSSDLLLKPPAENLAY